MSAHRDSGLAPTRALQCAFNTSNTLNTTHQTHRALDKHLGQVSDHKSPARGWGAASKLAGLSRQGTCSQLFLPVTSAFLKPLAHCCCLMVIIFTASKVFCILAAINPIASASLTGVGCSDSQPLCSAPSPLSHPAMFEGCTKSIVFLHLNGAYKSYLVRSG